MKERNRGRAQELSQSQGQEHRPSLHRVTTAPGASWQHSPIHSLHIKAEPLLNGVCFPPGTGFQGDSFIFSLRRDKITGEAKNNQQPPLAMSRLKPGGIWQHHPAKNISLYVWQEDWSLYPYLFPKPFMRSLPFRMTTV